MAEHQTISESSADLMQLKALRQQGAIGESLFAQLKDKLLSGNAQDIRSAQQDIHNLQTPTGNTPTPRKKGMGWLFKLFIVAIVAVVVTIIYLLMNLPNAHDHDEQPVHQNQDEQVEILLPKGAQDVVPTFTPGQSINEAFKARQAAKDGLLEEDGSQVVTTAPTLSAPPSSSNKATGGTTQKAANVAKASDAEKPSSQPKQQEAKNKPAQKKPVTSENIDNLF